MKRTASAVWNGDLKSGHGSISSASGVLANTQYSFATRFAEGIGTNPEELLAAAHAGCFAMALSLILGNAGFTAESIDAKATVSLEKSGAGFAITASHLDVVAKVPGATAADFEKAAQDAKTNCLVSKALNIQLSLSATLAG